MSRWLREGTVVTAAVLMSLIIGGVGAIFSGSPLLLLLAAILAAMVLFGLRGLDAIILSLFMAAAGTVSMLSVRIGPIVFADLLLAATALPLLVKGLRQRSAFRHLRSFMPILVCTGLMVIGGLGGSFGAANQNASLSELTQFTLSSVVMLLLIAMWSPNRNEIAVVALSFVVGAAVNAGTGIFLKDAGGRAMGLAGHANHLGLVSYLAIGIGVGLVLSNRSKQSNLILSFSLALLAYAILASGSRAALVGAGVALLLMLGCTRSWKLLSLAGVLSIALLVTIKRNLLPLDETNALSRVMGDRTSAMSDQWRLEKLDETLTSIGNNPVVGSGFEDALSAHSIYLQVWVAGGLLGLVFIVGILVIVARELMEATRKKDFMRLGLVCAYSGYLAAGMVSNALWDRYLWIVLALIIALGAINSKEGQIAIAPSGRSSRIDQLRPVGAP